MAQKPLDAAFSGSSESKKKKRGGFVAIIAVLGLAGISSVFAANVSINSTNPISYTQGTTTIAACDPNGITASLGAFFDATADTPAFTTDTITLEGVADTCEGKTIDVTIFHLGEVAFHIVATVEAVTGDSDHTLVFGVAGTALDAAEPVGTGWTGATATYSATGDPSGTGPTNIAANASRIAIEITD